MHSILIKIGGYPIYSYGMVLSIAIITGILFACRQGLKRGYDSLWVSDAGVWSVIMGIVGARLAFVLQNLDHYLADPISMLSLREGGISIQGAFLFGFATVAFCFRRVKIPALCGMDVYSAPMLYGMALGRLGCIFQGCCAGKVCSLPWGIVYPASANLGSLPRHPSQIYELILDLALMFLLMKIYDRAKFSGQTFWAAVAGYGVIRFITEFFREGSNLGLLTLAQWCSLAFLLIGLLGFWGYFGRDEVLLLEPTDEGEESSSEDQAGSDQPSA